MKTLVIHPTDITTSFLDATYLGRGWTIINHNPSSKELKEAIKTHDRIIMMGHGCERGLLGHGRLIINSELVYLLKDKDCVCIWCNADGFVKQYGLKGFYTGMIISEYEEAIYCSVPPTTEKVNESNVLFTEVIKNAIHLAPKEMCEQVKEQYKAVDNNIIDFNMHNIYHVL